ncbi:unnamed protein product [Caenorhabditis sp. 36 PRJEB53466]|nr:unnamed protein product [Caenorhabditis sp. 36 PRJEB53466]
MVRAPDEPPKKPDDDPQPPLNLGPNGEEISAPNYSYRNENCLFLDHPNLAPRERRLLEILQERVADAMLYNFDTHAQAMEISKVTFNALEELLRRGEKIHALFDEDPIESNIFRSVMSGEEFVREMNKFRSEWDVVFANQLHDDTITGVVACTDCDNMIKFGMIWDDYKGFYAISILNRVPHEMRLNC